MSNDKLQLNSRCLAYHGPLLYEARILKIHEPNKSFVNVYKNDSPQTLEEAQLPKIMHDRYGYFIHYKGWKATWDEWVDHSRILTYSFENIKLQKELKAAALAASTNQGAAISSSTSSKRSLEEDSSSNVPSTNNKKSKKNQDTTLEREDEFMKRPEISIVIPDNLKSSLVDDWEFITKENQLVSLPAKVTVNDILVKYQAFKIGNKKSIPNSGVIKEIIDGLKLYFNKSLGSILLYRFERQQYLDILSLEENKDKELVDIYGVEHLLRLFVSLPGLIAQTSMDQQSIGILKDFLEDVLKFLDKHYDEFFQRQYENVTPAYDSLVKN
ncbi:hypothetical protein PACTADRAFT_76782 [Pachysolen tannophilus NRRL Y-2460]|uniref:Chromatin modification-related protein EAF3 n=1 Tax=Pachysolen tannophilus NRRL Y-2460 TaxID=669874 RepID=A0A1E4TQV7_PACTA|nr:hypothetical protein PACTADRAFT_76782 [Pachysolen tannophilus NRRL Y-2460]